MDLTPTARLRPSTALMDSKFEWRVDPFESLFPNQDSTPPATSGRPILRDISAGTSDHRVRLVFCPFAPRYWRELRVDTHPDLHRSFARLNPTRGWIPRSLVPSM